MMSYRDDGQIQQGDERCDPGQAPQNDDSGSFGVKVQVQGINGRPYVVLNGQERDGPSPEYPDVFLMQHQQLELLSYMSGSASSTQTPRPDFRSLRPLKNPSTQLLNYQKSPEIHRPYDRRNNSLNIQSLLNHRITASQAARGCFSSPPSPVSASPVMVKRARLPVPAVAQDRFQDVMRPGDLAVENIPCKPSHIVCRLSVPATGDHPTEHVFTTSTDDRESPRVSRVGHRSRMGPEDKRRSRSAESRFGTLARTADAIPNIPRFGMEVENFPSSTHLLVAPRQQKAEVTDVRSAGPTGLEKEANTERSKVKETESPTRRARNSSFTPKRETQVTPDLLKGWQELPDQPDERTAKRVMFNYLKDGSSDSEDVIRQRVDEMFEKIHMLKSTAASTLELFQFTDPHMEVKNLKDRRAALESEISHLKQQLQRANMNSEQLGEENQKSQADIRRLQETLERSEQEQISLRHRLTDMEKDLQDSLDQLLQAKRARDQCRADMRDLQQQLSDIHDELDSTKSSEAGERDRLLQDLSALRGEFETLQQVYEEQGEMLHHRQKEIMALRGALQEEVSAHARDVETLKEEHQQEVQKLLRATEEAKESVAALGQKVLQVAAERGTSQTQISELSQNKAQLQEKVRTLEEQITSLNDIIQQNHKKKNHLQEHVDQLKMENQHLEVELMEARQQEEEMCGANHTLMRHLENTQSELTGLNRAHRDLKEKLQDERREMEELQKRKSELEEERRNQNRVFELLQEEMSAVVLGSERDTERLQEAVDTIRDQNQRELDALHTQLLDTHTQLQTHTQAAQEHHRERCVLEDKLSRYELDLKEATMKTQQLQKRIQQLEEERHTHEDKQVKLLEVRVLELEDHLTEEQSSSDLLMKTLERERQQIEQARTDLLQERATRQDLECDRISLERQNKELRCRMSQLEASQHRGQDALTSKLQLRIQQLEEKLLQGEKENNDLQQQNRKLERKMKEKMMLQEEEHLSLQDQRDQLVLRLKSLKRQLDEAEEEIERLENSKRKLQRDVEEQQEMNDQLQTQLSALLMEIRRNKRLNTMQTTDEDDDEDERAVSSD